MELMLPLILIKSKRDVPVSISFFVCFYDILPLTCKEKI